MSHLTHMTHDSAQILVTFSAGDTQYVARYRQSAGQVEFVAVDGRQPEVKVPAADLEDAKRVALSYLADEWPDSTVH